jgi:hypothetical protein
MGRSSKYSVVLRYRHKSLQHCNDCLAPLKILLLERNRVLHPVPDVLGETLHCMCVMSSITGLI